MKRPCCLFLLALALACGKFGPDASVVSELSSDESSHDMIVLGERLDDPFTVENMTKAFCSLYPTKSGRSAIEPTDYYVRFLPTGEQQYDHLREMGLTLIDHPLDYSILQEGDWYHDPSVPEGNITWQYAVVPVDFSFPQGYRWERIDECFLPEHQSGTKSVDIDWSAVERESFRLTGNSLSAVSTKGGGNVLPSGRITIVDDAYDDEPIGVKGVMVCANSFVRISTAYTDDEGYYELPRSFNSDKVRYRLVFRNERGFNIGFNLLLVPASTSALGKYGPEGVSVNVDRNSEYKLFTRCVVNNAGYDYIDFCKSTGSTISSPPAGLRFWLFRSLSLSASLMLQQGVLVDGSILSDYLGEYTELLKVFLPDTILGLKGQNDYKSIYLLAIHHFAHASHYSQVGTVWWNDYVKYLLTSFVKSVGMDIYGSGNGHCELSEMWAYYIQSVVARERYGDGEATYGTSWWFSPQILTALDERGINRFWLFAAFSPDIADRELLEKKLISLYPEFKSEIMQIFVRYN